LHVRTLSRSSYCQGRLTRVGASILNTAVPPKSAGTILDMNVWWASMQTRVKHTRPLMDMMATHAWRRRHPISAPRRCKHYSTHMVALARLYLMSGLASIYGGSRATNRDQDRAERGKFTDGMSQLMVLNVDEPQNGNQKNRKSTHSSSSAPKPACHAAACGRRPDLSRSTSSRHSLATNLPGTVSFVPSRQD
jgi:hypothetical protein